MSDFVVHCACFWPFMSFEKRIIDKYIETQRDILNILH